jgi:hypothetical protein
MRQRPSTRADVVPGACRGTQSLARPAKCWAAAACRLCEIFATFRPEQEVQQRREAGPRWGEAGQGWKAWRWHGAPSFCYHCQSRTALKPGTMACRRHQHITQGWLLHRRIEELNTVDAVSTQCRKGFRHCFDTARRTCAPDTRPLPNPQPVVRDSVRALQHAVFIQQSQKTAAQRATGP